MSPNKWPVQYPDRVQLYTYGTPNGHKASIALEEMDIPYEAHLVDIMVGDQFEDEFIAVNPNSKIPALVDPDGPGGKPHVVFESGAIVLYLAEKSGKLLSSDPAARSETLQWLFFQMGGVGPMFGQFGHFYTFAPEKVPYALTRYTNETRRLLNVLEKRLDGRDYLMGDAYTIADVATFPWPLCLDTVYDARSELNLDQDFPRVMAWVERCTARPATARGLAVP